MDILDDVLKAIPAKEEKKAPDPNPPAREGKSMGHEYCDKFKQLYGERKG